MSNVSDAEKESFFWYSKSKNAIPECVIFKHL